MFVKTHGNREAIGLLIGAANARRYFPKEMGAVELRMGDLSIECRLTPEFWNGEPEIHDPRLCEWLKFKTMHERSSRKPVMMAMVQSGANSFTLQSLSTQGRRGPRVQPAA